MPGSGVIHMEGVEESVQVDACELDLISGKELLQNYSNDIQMKGDTQAFPVFKAVPNTDNVIDTMS